MNFSHFLEHSAKYYGERTAIIYNDKKYSYEELNTRTNRLANSLIHLGVKHGDRVGIVCSNSNQYVEIVYACSKIGAVSTHINWRLSSRKIEKIIESANCKIVFYSKQFEESYTGLNKEVTGDIILISDDGGLKGSIDYEKLISKHSQDEPDAEIHEEDILLQMFTSGTTNLPKAVMLTHKNVVSHAKVNIIETKWTEDERYLCVLPMFHIGGFSGIVSNIAVGGTTVIQNGFNLERYLLTIEKDNITITGITPTQIYSILKYEDLNKYDISSLETLIYSSAPMSVNILKKAQNYFNCKFLQIYGMTEMSPSVTILTPENHVLEGEEHLQRRLNSVGRPMMDVSIRVIDEFGNECDINEIGEIICKGDGMMLGYYGMPEETEKAFKDGWYHTGDLGKMDEYGYLYLVGRKSDMIISGGENIYPNEIEECIRRASDEILDVAVIGVFDEKWGENVKAIVVKTIDSKVNEDDIISYCKKNIASYKKPKSVDFVKELPRNANNKILKNVLKEHYQNNGNQRH